MQAKLQREEAEAANLMKKHVNFDQISQNLRGDQNLPAYNHYFWETVLSSADRRKLSSYNIKSFDDLFAAYEVAQAKMSRPPYPLIGELEPHLRYAHELYESIPERLDANRSDN